MSTDLLERLAELPVPPPPPPKTFDRAVHQRINSRLIVGQILDLLFRGFGYAVLQFAKVTLSALQFTFTGKLPDNKHDRGQPPV
ncbi:MAG TPA: hypothetical protein VFE46_18485 [Pirellulales bacterium]|jgi:hypothetical protein|nr:hypothetical protein [Pirellulales bacterium]